MKTVICGATALAARRPLASMAHTSPPTIAVVSVLSAGALVKRYRMGDLDVVELRGVDLERLEGEVIVLTPKQDQLA